MQATENLLLRLEIDAFNADYAGCIDDDALERWPDFFAEDCLYRITTAENLAANRPLGLIYANSRNMLRDRVVSLRQANIYEPQRYSHQISCLKLGARQGELLEATASFLVVRTMQGGEMSIFAAGRYRDQFRRIGEGWTLQRRIVVLDSKRIDTLLAFPL